MSGDNWMEAGIRSLTGDQPGERCWWLELEWRAWRERVVGYLGVRFEALLIGCGEGLGVVFK